MKKKRFVALFTTCALLAMPFTAYGTNVASVNLNPEQGTYLFANISIGDGGVFGNPYTYRVHLYGTYADAVTAWYSVGTGSGNISNVVKQTRLFATSTSITSSRNAGSKKTASIAVWYGTTKNYSSASSSQRATATSKIS